VASMERNRRPTPVGVPILPVRPTLPNLLKPKPHEARGGDEIVRFATAMWECERTYVADPRQIVQARDTALLVAERSINVARRGSDGAWRYAIALLSPAVSTTKEEQ